LFAFCLFVCFVCLFCLLFVCFVCFVCLFVCYFFLGYVFSSCFVIVFWDCSHSILSFSFFFFFFCFCFLILSSSILLPCVSLFKKKKELHITRPSSLSDYPFVLSRKSKGEISSDFKEEANSLDTAAKILGVSAGGLLFASVAIGVSNVVSK